MGTVYRAYVNANGVKTRGTASGTIFVLRIDPFLQLSRLRCGPRDFGRVFADDIGYVIFDLYATLLVFADCFELFGSVSNVKLKIKKTVIVPLIEVSRRRGSSNHRGRGAGLEGCEGGIASKVLRDAVGASYRRLDVDGGTREVHSESASCTIDRCGIIVVSSRMQHNVCVFLKLHWAVLCHDTPSADDRS